MLDNFIIVLGGPISRRTPGYRILRHFETVRHELIDFTTPIPHCTRGHFRFLHFAL